MTTLTRRTLIKTAGKLVVAGGALTLAARMPSPAEARALEGHASYCGAPFGPMHRYLYATAPDPVWQDAVIWRESNWNPSAKNPSSTASGLAQFLDSTWGWGQELYGISGSPFDWQACIDMMNAFIADGGYSHWYLTGWEFPRGLSAAAGHGHDMHREQPGG
jgi:hypothetical protein